MWSGSNYRNDNILECVQWYNPVFRLAAKTTVRAAGKQNEPTPFDKLELKIHQHWG